MVMPNISAQAKSEAKSGDAYSSGSQITGEMNFGGSGSGGGNSGMNLGAMATQYWPLLAAAGVIWWVRKKSK